MSPDPVDLLSRLIRFDTTNPPGNERACVTFLADLISQAGIPCRTVSADPARPNLLARLPGRGAAPPLLLYGHVDVVTTAHQAWTHPPFEGHILDDSVWGRGALDMKGGVAMMTSAFLRAAQSSPRPPGDVLLAILVDEEAGGRNGARFLVEKHAKLFEGVRHAIGEFGGIPIDIAGHRVYAIQVAEKQPCWIEAALRGPAGHGALPMRGGAVAGLSRTIEALERRRTPVHVTSVTRSMIESIAAHVGGLRGSILRALLRPHLTDRVLDLLGDAGRPIEPLLRNTVNITVIRAGERPNVIPSEIVVGLDGRLLPGYGPSDLVDEIRALVDEPLDLHVLLHDPSPCEPDVSQFDMLAGILEELEPGVPSVPLLLPGSTDGRFFSRIGIQTYGFTPMNLPRGFDFFSTIHAADEQIPCAAVHFGTEAIYRLLQRYEGTPG